MNRRKNRTNLRLQWPSWSKRRKCSTKWSEWSICFRRPEEDRGFRTRYRIRSNCKRQDQTQKCTPPRSRVTSSNGLPQSTVVKAAGGPPTQLSQGLSQPATGRTGHVAASISQASSMVTASTLLSGFTAVLSNVTSDQTAVQFSENEPDSFASSVESHVTTRLYVGVVLGVAGLITLAVLMLFTIKRLRTSRKPPDVATLCSAQRVTQQDLVDHDYVDPGTLYIEPSTVTSHVNMSQAYLTVKSVYQNISVDGRFLYTENEHEYLPIVRNSDPLDEPPESEHVYEPLTATIPTRGACAYVAKRGVKVM